MDVEEDNQDMVLEIVIITSHIVMLLAHFREMVEGEITEMLEIPNIEIIARDIRMVQNSLLK